MALAGVDDAAAHLFVPDPRCVPVAGYVFSACQLMKPRTLLVLAIAASAFPLGSCNRAPSDLYQDRAKFCAFQVCDTKFEALRMNGEGQLLVHLGEHGRFYLVDWRTSDQIVAGLSFAPESAEVDATGYVGILDAE